MWQMLLGENRTRGYFSEVMEALAWKKVPHISEMELEQDEMGGLKRAFLSRHTANIGHMTNSNKAIKSERLMQYAKDFNADRANLVAANAAVSAGVLEAATDYKGQRSLPRDFSIELKQAPSPTNVDRAAAGCSHPSTPCVMTHAQMGT